MKLSNNFSLREMCKSGTAIRNGIDNKPSIDVIRSLRGLCKHVLQPVREHFGKPVTVSSGYRAIALNRFIGGSDTSDHCGGFAADIEIPGISNKALAEWIRDNCKYSQLILEFYVDGITNSGWVHVSYNPSNLKEEYLHAERVDGKVRYTRLN